MKRGVLYGLFVVVVEITALWLLCKDEEVGFLFWLEALFFVGGSKLGATLLLYAKWWGDVDEKIKENEDMIRGALRTMYVGDLGVMIASMVYFGEMWTTGIVFGEVIFVAALFASTYCLFGKLLLGDKKGEKEE